MNMAHKMFQKQDKLSGRQKNEAPIGFFFLFFFFWVFFAFFVSFKSSSGEDHSLLLIYNALLSLEHLCGRIRIV